MQRNIQSIDLTTGEVLKGALVWVTDRPKVREAFFMAFQAAFMSLAKDVELQGQPMRVLLVLLARLDFENEVVISQAEIARELEIRPNRVSEAMRLLREKGLIRVQKREGHIKTYRLSCAYAWKGRAKNLHGARRAHTLALVK